MNQTSGQSFSAMIRKEIANDYKEKSMWNWLFGLGLALGGLLIAFMTSEPWEDVFIAMMLMVALGLLFLAVQIKDALQIVKMKAKENDWGFLKTFGIEASNQTIMENLNQDYQDGKMLFVLDEKKDEYHKESIHVFMFSDYLVYIYGTRLYVISVDKLYWAYTSTRTNKNRVVGYEANFYTDQRSILFSLKDEADAVEVVRELNKNYGIKIGYDSDLKKLFSKNRTEFIKQMEAFKRCGGKAV